MNNEKITDIEELIADAKAEEEVAREQAKEESKRKFKEELEAHLKDAFSESMKARKESKVTIDLNEYVLLKFKERDLEKIVGAIVSVLKLGYNNEYLRINDGDKIVDVIKVIYPEAYEAILEDLIEEAETKEG